MNWVPGALHDPDEAVVEPEDEAAAGVVPVRPGVDDGHDQEEDGEVVRQVEQPVVGPAPQGQGQHDCHPNPGKAGLGAIQYSVFESFEDNAARE